MSGNKEIECLFSGDPRVRVLLGKQKRAEAGDYVRRSQFVYSLYMRGQYLLFHTLTRRLLQACGVL